MAEARISFLLVLLLLSSACLEQPRRVEETRELLGTFVTITVIDYDTNRAGEALTLAFDEIGRVESLLSEYRNDSQVALLNENGLLENPSNELLHNLRSAVRYSNLSNGAFDITIKPLLDLYSISFGEKKRPPTSEEINETLKLVDYRQLEISTNRIKFLKPRMKITLGGIAKGYAIDRAIDILREMGIKNALVNAGGDIRALGNKENNLPWRIALENPRNRSQFLAVIYLDDESVTTSGDYQRYFDPEKKFHHIVNPKTGYSASELMSVTIITEQAIDADALSTAVFVLGPEKGIELIEKLEGVEGLLITSQREIITSSGFQA